MMLLRYRRRHASYPLAQASVVPGITRRAITLIIVAFLLFLTASWLLNRFGTESAFRRAASLVAIDERGTVNVSLEGNPPQRGQSAMKLYAGDLLTTGNDAHAAVRFFDGTIARLDESSDIMIEESKAGEEEKGGVLTLDLRKGSVWLMTPDLRVFSGSISRAVTTPALIFSLPPATEALLSIDSLTVFSADGVGITVELPEHNRSLVVGEGQQWTMPTIIDEETDLYASREPIDLLTTSSPFIEESRTKVRGLALRASRQGSGAGDSSSSAASVSVASAPPETLIASPVITSPAESGQVYRTEKVELVLRGKAPTDAAGIMVNEYQLKLFTPEKGTWSYLASLELGNLKPGTNTYDVFTLDSLGRKSDPVRITIIQGEGPEGVATEGQVSSSGQAASQAPLQNNAPLTQGILTITAPEPGMSHTHTGTGFLLEGTTSAATHSIWVNDYRLHLYQPGKTTWNYLATEELQTLKPGRNVYRIIARNEKGEVLDVLEYNVEKR